jgi:hypothetical protein
MLRVIHQQIDNGRVIHDPLLVQACSRMAGKNTKRGSAER